MSVSGGVHKHIAVALVEVVEGERVRVRFPAVSGSEVGVVPGDPRYADPVHAADEPFLAGTISTQSHDRVRGRLDIRGGRSALELTVDVEPNLRLAVIDSGEV